MALALQPDIYLEQVNLWKDPHIVTGDVRKLVDSKNTRAAVEDFLSKYPQLSYTDDLIPGRHLFQIDLSPVQYKTREKLDDWIEPLSPENFMSVAERLVSYIQEIRAINNLYAVCDTIIQADHSKGSLEKLKLYHFVYELTDFLEFEIKKRILPFADPEEYTMEVDGSLYSHYQYVYAIPFIRQKAAYRGFEDRLKKYELALDPFTISPFWNNPKAMDAANQIIWKNELLGKNASREDIDLMQGPVSDLAIRIRKCIDSHVNSMIYKKVWLTYAGDQHSLGWCTSGVDIALYLWLMTTQLTMSKDKPKICPICGEVFLTSRSDKVYCNAHTKSDRERYLNMQKQTKSSKD